MRGLNNIIFSAAHATFDESLFPRCPKRTLQNNTRLQEVAPPVAPCGGDNCHCPPPNMEDDDDTSHLFSRTSRKVVYDAQEELDQRLRDVDVTPSQRQGMRMPPPRISASQDRPPTPTGDKDQNTHQAHAGYIGSTDNKVTPMCPVGIGWVHFKCPLPWGSNLPRPEQAGYI